MKNKNHKFRRGDLVKNKKSVTWRDQSALGIIIEDVGMFSGRQLVKIKWIKSGLPKETKNLWQIYYAKSLELVASVSK
tara:strand:+ start:1201 stop:1434 length:234 start_codon:yes stop_codon:yes gene_type:complete